MTGISYDSIAHEGTECFRGLFMYSDRIKMLNDREWYAIL